MPVRVELRRHSSATVRSFAPIVACGAPRTAMRDRCQDFPSVLEITAQNARAAGVPITILPGSAFTVDLGTGYDAVIVTNLFLAFAATVNLMMYSMWHQVR